MIVSIDKNKAFNKIQLIYDFKSLRFFYWKSKPYLEYIYFFNFQSPFNVTKSKLFEFAEVNVVVEHW